jgi:hypothetical protein
MIPLGQCARREALRFHVALVQDDERVRREPHRWEIERRFEGGNVARIERRHEVVEDFLRCGD